MKIFLPVVFSLLAIGPLAMDAQGVDSSTTATASQKLTSSRLVSSAKAVSPTIKADYGKLPLSFEANQGQSDPQVKFLSRGQRYSLFITDSAAVLALTKELPSQPKPAALGGNAGFEKAANIKSDVVRMELAGAARGMQVSGVDPLPGKVNYFFGKDSSKWHSNVPTYAKVKYSNVYPGIDLVYYGNQQQLEYDFIVAPRANPKQARLHFAGASKLKLNCGGDLEIIAKDGEIAFHKPVVYQLKDGQRQRIEGGFHLLANNTIGFTLANYDHSRELVIDPVLAYSTYLGGSGTSQATAIAVDANGEAYVTGDAYSSDFPVTAAAFQTTFQSSFEGRVAFVTKFNPAGTALIYSTFIAPGSPTGIKVDKEGNAYLTGIASSEYFPVTEGAFQTVDKCPFSQRVFCSIGFISKLNPKGSALIYSTYLGGTGNPSPSGYPFDTPNAIAIDLAGNAYVTGTAVSSDFPVTSNAFQKKQNCTHSVNSCSNAFVTQLNATGSALVYSTYLGGSGVASGTAIAVNVAGSAFVTGSTTPEFPVTAEAFQRVLPGSQSFVTRLNPGGSSLAYSTLLGDAGGGETDAAGIAVDSASNAYVTGLTYGADFPVTGHAYQKVNRALANSGYDSFISKLNPSGSGLVYSTYLGGGALPYDQIRYYGDAAAGIVIDRLGNAFVTGWALSSDFPVTSDALKKTNSNSSDSFVTVFNSNGSGLIYSTYFGGDPIYNGPDATTSIAVDGLGNAYIAGYESSYDFPTTPGAFQVVNPAEKDLEASRTAFTAKFAFHGATTTTVTSNHSSAPVGEEVAFTAHVEPLGESGIQTGGISWKVDGQVIAHSPLDGNGDATYSTGSLSAGPHLIVAAYLGEPDVYSASSGTITVTANQVATPTFPKLGGTYPTGETIKIETSTAGASIYYTTNGITPTTASTKYTGPLLISETSTVKAIAVASGYANSPVASATYTITPGAITTTTTLISSANPSTAGNPVKFTATVIAASGPAPTGTVTFKNGGVVLGSAPLTDGTASLTASNLALDGNAIAAIYTGTATDAASAATLTQQVR
ncbi:SBBP repeat-containing protein [Acidisarcina polymorpha]|nr:SBBP repeat-containing protein [Acidisarcina polymorpha]